MAQDIRTIAERNGFSEGAARALAEALRSGGGGMAQFSHPELGGMGQWSRGGMLMIGAMNDHDLKARVARLADDLASAGPGILADGAGGAGAGSPRETPKPASTSPWAQGGDTEDDEASRPAPSSSPSSSQSSASRSSSSQSSGNWWPGDLGQPSSSGAQNGVRYAAFPSSRRLAIEQNGTVAVYDTGDHRISGVSQSQSGTGPGNLRFTSQHGDVDLAGLTRV